MFSLVPTSRTFRWRGAVTWPCLVGILSYLISIGALFWVNRSLESGLSPCLFRNATGIPCFLCGGTRASFALAGGKILTAFALNPLVSFTLILAGCLILLKAVFGLKVQLPRISRGWLWISAIVIVAANWIYVAAHL